MFGKIKKILTAPESTQTCTSRCTDFKVLPVNRYTAIDFINLSFLIIKVKREQK